MREQAGVLLKLERRAVGQVVHAAARAEVGTNQEVAVAAHKNTSMAAPAARSTWPQWSSKLPGSALSSPTQTSNRSPRMNTASAGVCSM